MKCIKASTPPSPPIEIRVESTGREFLVRWRHPLNNDGEILGYLVNYNILPSFRVYTNIVKGNKTFSLIPFSDHIGQLFLISIQAENDYGLSKQSGPRYIRAGCGESFHVWPESSKRFQSPFYPHDFNHGVLCIWKFSTNITHSLSIHIRDLYLGPDNPTCVKNYVLIETRTINKKICSSNVTDIRLESSEVKILFKSGMDSTGKGLSMDVNSVVKKPDPPINITLSSLGKVILVTWSPPTGNHLPISSYKICYQALPTSSKLCLSLLANRGNRFIINTRDHEGQVFAVSMTSRIDDVESGVSKNKYYRAMCSKTVVVHPDELINITSPAYPRYYPPSVVCQWRVRTSDQRSLKLRLMWIDIQNTTGCNSDYLQLTSTNVDRICGTSEVSRTINFSRGSTYLKFVSDENMAGRGFLLQAFSFATTGRLTTKISTSYQTSQLYSLRTSSFPVYHTKPSPMTTIVYSTSYTTKSPSTAHIIPTSSLDVLMSSQYSSILPITNGTSNILITITPTTNFRTTAQTTSLNATTTGIAKETTEAKAGSLSVTDISINETLSTATTATATTTTITKYSNSVSIIESYTDIGESSTRVWKTEQTTSPLYQDKASTYQPATFQPDIDINMTQHVYLLLMFRFNVTNTMIWNNGSHIIEQLLEEMTPYFNNSQLFQGISIYKWKILRGIIPVQVQINYNTVKLLDTMKINTSFRLLQSINRTTISRLLVDNNTWSYNLTLDKSTLQKLRNNDNFVNQEIRNPCYLVTSICTRCSVSRSAKHGIVCLDNIVRTTVRTPYRPSDSRTMNETYVIIISVTVCIVMVLCLVVVIRLCQKGISSKNIVVQRNIQNIPVHDFVKNKYSTTVKLTSFSIQKHLKKRRGWSFPNRVTLERQKNDHDLEDKVKKLAIFIDDTDTLKERLKMKMKHRRGHSL